MLAEIHIQNYAVIENLSLALYPGLNLLSGETGSGKSIVVDALGLTLGGRASPDVIRSGADCATITAIFASERRAPWRKWLEKYGIGSAEGSEIILRREIHSNGRSRLLVNDQPVTLAAVKELGRWLVEVCGQNEQATLFSRDAQRNLLDQFAALEGQAQVVAERFRSLRELERELETLERSEQERWRSIDLLKFQLQELDAARLQPGEDAALEAERQLLTNLEKVRSAAGTAYNQLYEDEGSALSRLSIVQRAFEDLRRYDTQAGPYADSLASSKAVLEEIAFFLRDYLGKWEADPARLESVEDRLALIGSLKRKYGKTIEEILRYRDEACQRLTILERAGERRQEVERSLRQAANDYHSAAANLSAARRAAALRLEKLVCQELAQMGMEKTRFQVRVTRVSGEGGREVEIENGRAGDRESPRDTSGSVVARDESSETRAPKSEAARPATGFGSTRTGGPHGIDEIDFLISPHPGDELRPLERIASGGELSRLMLALKTVVGEARLVAKGETRRSGTAGAQGSEWEVRNSQGPFVGADSSPIAPTFVFDEVDAGIGGRVAESVGRRLRRLARSAQVICVTHLAQIACFADHHYCVEKLERGGRVMTEVKHLRSASERAAELARMLSGRHITEAVQKHAAAMLKQAARAEE